jgi:hypothetical protein
MEEIGIDAAPASAPAAEVGPVFEVEPEPLVAEPEPLDADASRPAAEPIADDDLEGLDYLASAEEDAAPADSPPPDPLLSTPLFQGFSKEELLAVMRGMSLRTFDAGDILVAEGAPGDSLFVLTTGSVKCWVKDAAGQYVKVHEFPEGAFFGEISILTGRPRTATLTAAGACEVLELDKAAFDDIAARHPHVVEVLRKFHEQRAIDTVQALSRKTRR